jgi:signal transduction histidine kinase
VCIFVTVRRALKTENCDPLTSAGQAPPEPRRALRRDADIRMAELRAAVHEQERISAELHDGLGQHLTGIAFLAKALANKLHSRGAPEAPETDQIVGLINQAVANTRSLARGLQPVGPEDNALSVALLQLAGDISKVYAVDCKFSTDDTVRIFSRDAAHHLYRIAQEAVNNAIAHGGADQITIELSKFGRGIVLSITNNGTAYIDNIGRLGQGLFSMRRRAQILRAKFLLENLPLSGVRLRIVMGSKISKMNEVAVTKSSKKDTL